MAKKKDAYEKWEERGELENKLVVIMSLSMQGWNIEQIARHQYINLSGRTLRTLSYRHELVSSSLKKGRDVVVGICQNKLMQNVNDGDTTAIIYALKVYGGDFFKDSKSIKAELSGFNGNPIGFQQVQVYLPEKEELE